jgi:hypothetical protein
MNFTRSILITAFIIVLAIMAYYSYAFIYYNASGIPELQITRESDAAQKILEQWTSIPTSKGNLVPFAMINTGFDFLFIPLYVALVIMYSDNRLQKEPALWLNTLLRLNMFLIVIAGILDIAENLALLYNLQYGKDQYINLWWLSWLKYILAVWTVLVWLVSKVKSFFLS